MNIEKWFPRGNYSLVSKRLSEHSGELLWAWRETPKREDDSGWRFLSLHDTQQTLSREAPRYLTYEDLLEIEPAIAKIYSYPVGIDAQLARHQGKKQFVYNDTFELVQGASDLVTLPLDDPAFRQHFPTVARLLDRQHHQRTYGLDQKELDQLNQATQQIEQLISVLLGTRTDELTDSELYLLTGIALGYQERLQQDFLNVPMHRLTNFLLAYLERRFHLSLAEGQQIVWNYQHDDNEPAIQKQMMRYGQAFYQWLKDQKLAEINEEYRQICAYYLTDRD
ncbi:MAG: DUF2185 domain-containing protein [Aerococcus sp.]|nr:DUF2185 domain-containing protein [Aerococcus sp.]